MRPCALRPPLFLTPSTSDFSGRSRVTSARSDQVAKRRPGLVGLCRLTATLLPDLLALEQLDVIVRMELDDRLLPRARLAGGVAAALRLRLDAHRAHVAHAHVEDLLDRLANLGLVRAVVDPERVLVRRQEGIALLGHDRADDDGARVHFFDALLVRSSSALGVRTSRPCPTMSAMPAASDGSTVTPRRLRKDFTALSS